MNLTDTLGYIGTATGILVGLGGGVAAVYFGIKMTRGLTSEVGAITSHVAGITKSLAPNMQLLVTGEPAEATVVAAEETGLRLQGIPVLRLLLDVRRAFGAVYRPDQQSYRVETKAMVPDLKFAQIQPGSLVAVRLDPRDLTQVAVALR